jgi:hypothetical protein
MVLPEPPNEARSDVTFGGILSEPRYPRLKDWNILRMFASEMQNVWAFPDCATIHAHRRGVLNTPCTLRPTTRPQYRWRLQQTTVGAGFARPAIKSARRGGDLSRPAMMCAIMRQYTQIGRIQYAPTLHSRRAGRPCGNPANPPIRAIGVQTKIRVNTPTRTYFSAILPPPPHRMA